MSTSAKPCPIHVRQRRWCAVCTAPEVGGVGDQKRACVMDFRPPDGYATRHAVVER